MGMTGIWLSSMIVDEAFGRIEFIKYNPLMVNTLQTNIVIFGLDDRTYIHGKPKSGALSQPAIGEQNALVCLIPSYMVCRLSFRQEAYRTEKIVVRI